jgi:hypothetical protein
MLVAVFAATRDNLSRVVAAYRTRGTSRSALAAVFMNRRHKPAELDEFAGSGGLGHVFEDGSGLW